jgi:hypothetical protein
LWGSGCKFMTRNRESGCCPTSTCHIVNIHSITWSCWIVSTSKEDKFTWRSCCKLITSFTECCCCVSDISLLLIIIKLKTINQKFVFHSNNNNPQEFQE